MTGVNALISRLEASNSGAESSATATPLSQTYGKNKVNRNFGGGGSGGGAPAPSSATNSITTTMPRVVVGSLHKPPISPTKNSFQLENREHTMQMLQAHSEPKLKLEPEDDSTFGAASASDWSAAQNMTTGATNPAAAASGTTTSLDPKAASRKPNHLVKSTFRANNKSGTGPTIGTGSPSAFAPVAATTAAPALPATTAAPAPAHMCMSPNSKVIRKTSIKASELGIKLTENSTPGELEEAVKKWKADQRMKQHQQQQGNKKGAVTPEQTQQQKPDPDGNRQRSKSRGRARSKSRGRDQGRASGGDDGGRERSRSRSRGRGVQQSNSARPQSRGRAKAGTGGGGGGNATDRIVHRSQSSGPIPSSKAAAVGVDALALSPRRPNSRGRPRILRAVSDAGDADPSAAPGPKKPTVMKRIIVRRRSLLGSTTSTTAANYEPGTEPQPTGPPTSEQIASMTPITSNTAPGNDSANTPATTNPTGDAEAAAAAPPAGKESSQMSPPTPVKNNPVPSWEYLITPPCAKKKAAPAPTPAPVAATPTAGAPAPATGIVPTGQNAKNPPPQRQVKRSTSGSSRTNAAEPSSAAAAPVVSRSTNPTTTTTTDPCPPSPEVIPVRRPTSSSRSPAKSRIAAAALDHAEIQKRLAVAGISQEQYMAMLKAGLNITLA